MSICTPEGEGFYKVSLTGEKRAECDAFAKQEYADCKQDLSRRARKWWIVLAVFLVECYFITLNINNIFFFMVFNAVCLTLLYPFWDISLWESDKCRERMSNLGTLINSNYTFTYKMSRNVHFNLELEKYLARPEGFIEIWCYLKSSRTYSPDKGSDLLGWLEERNSVRAKNVESAKRKEKNLASNTKFDGYYTMK